MKVSIITAALNRLEYTIKCIYLLKEYGGYDNYEHIIVTQGSTDGTVEWLNWAKKHKNFEKVLLVHNGVNKGPWEGIKTGLEYATGELIIQLENDMFIYEPNWVHILKELFPKVRSANPSDNVLALMLKRMGVRSKMKGRILGEYEALGESYLVRLASRPVACYMMDAEEMKELSTKVPSCEHIRFHGHTAKVWDLEAYHLLSPEYYLLYEGEKIGDLKERYSKRYIKQH